MSEKEAFFQVCAEAAPASSSYVSLYRIESFYGGPEEGGWWGRDYVLVAYQEVSNDVEAEALRQKIAVLAEDLSKQAKDNFNRGCAAQVEWLEARGLDDDFLPEVDGEDSYIVLTENKPGENAYKSSRYYE